MEMEAKDAAFLCKMNVNKEHQKKVQQMKQKEAQMMNKLIQKKFDARQQQRARGGSYQRQDVQ